MNPQTVHVLCQGDVHISNTYLSPEGELLTSVLDSTPSPANDLRAADEQPFVARATRGAGRFFKLDANGNPLPQTATDHVIVRDLVSGLDWLVAYATDKAVPHAEALESASKVTAGGHNNWRLPERLELESILDITRYKPAIDPALFPGTKSERHWTASPDASDPAYAWLVNFYYGGANPYDRDDLGFVRAVRSVSSAPASQ